MRKKKPKKQVKKETKKNEKKRGRPKLEEGKARGKMTQFRTLPNEREAFEKAASERGLTLSDWIRETLNRSLKQ